MESRASEQAVPPTAVPPTAGSFEELVSSLTLVVNPEPKSRNVAWDPEIGVRLNAVADFDFGSIPSSSVTAAFSGIDRLVQPVLSGTPAISLKLCGYEGCEKTTPVDGHTRWIYTDPGATTNDNVGSGRMYSFIPDTPLFGGRTYKVEISSVGAVGLGGNVVPISVLAGRSEWTFKTAEKTQFVLPLNILYENTVCHGGKRDILWEGFPRYSRSDYPHADKIGKNVMCKSVDQVSDLVFGQEEFNVNHWLGAMSNGKMALSPLRDVNGHVRHAIQIDRQKGTPEDGGGTCFRTFEYDGTQQNNCPQDRNKTYAGRSILDEVDTLFDFSRYREIYDENGKLNVLPPYRPSRENIESNGWHPRFHKHGNTVIITNIGTDNPNCALGAAIRPTKYKVGKFTVCHEEDPRTWVH